jgi:hypothetical protein
MYQHLHPQAHIVTVDMGYGHQRASYPLRFLSPDGKVIIANNYNGMPESDLNIWEQGRKPYEFISRLKRVPLIGDLAFWGMDQMQKIDPFYPRRKLYHPSLQLKTSVLMIRKKHWGKHLIDSLNQNPLPLITTFFTVAYMAEEFKYQGDIYLVVCDADVSRAWVSIHPASSRIKYLVPNRRVYERLQLYGALKSNIIFTGFPLPKENLGDEKLDILKKDLGLRLRNLDPEDKYIAKYRKTIVEHLGPGAVPKKSSRPLTITFAVGGAGAQRELGVEILKSLKKNIVKNQVRVNLIAGIRSEVRDYFSQQIVKLGICGQHKNNINLCYEPIREKYFADFNGLLRETDILWTKPSELSFYVGLGIPIIIAPPIGSQEKFNRHWLRSIGAGVMQENPKYVNEWLFDWLKSGWLAEAAMQGFFEAPKYGTFNIEKIIAGQIRLVKEPDAVLQY